MQSVESELNAYLSETEDLLGMDLRNPQVKNAYDMSLASAMSALQETDFWAKLPTALEQLSSRYRTQNHADLFQSSVGTVPHLLKKSFASLQNKVYRINVVWNRNHPKPPDDGFVAPDNWYGRVDDLLRTTLVCNYSDGPALTAKAIVALAKANGLVATVRKIGQDGGYYAQHVYVSFEAILGHSSKPISTEKVTVEIQVITQMQSILRQLTHQFYEHERLKRNPDRSGWKWELNSPRFTASYLGHTLHLLEALVVDLRDRMSAPESDSHDK